MADLKIMIDSGAYSVYNSGAEIDLSEYIAFCKTCPRALFVNLDVIPKVMTSECVRDSARRGWENWQRMTEELPPERVLPVFHRGEPLAYLEKYIRAGCTYIGMGGVAGESDAERIRRMREVTKVTAPAEVRLHGFGVASWRSLSAFKWYSVDSTTWTRHAHVWQVLIPRSRSKGYDYREEPLVLGLSPRSTGKTMHIDRLSPVVRSRVMAYLEECGAELGEIAVEERPPGHKRLVGEYWLDSKKRAVVRSIRPGIRSDGDARCRLNARMFCMAARAFGVTDFYFSGLSYCPEWVGELGCVLLSFSNIIRGYEQWL